MVRPIPKYKPYRSKKYLAFIREHPCLICGNPETIAHHESLGKNAMGSKPPDSHAVPLCNECHMRRHATGAFTFWGGYDVQAHIIELLTEYIERIEPVHK